MSYDSSFLLCVCHQAVISKFKPQYTDAQKITKYFPGFKDATFSLTIVEISLVSQSLNSVSN